VGVYLQLLLHNSLLAELHVALDMASKLYFTATTFEEYLEEVDYLNLSEMLVRGC